MTEKTQKTSKCDLNNPGKNTKIPKKQKELTNKNY